MNKWDCLFVLISIKILGRIALCDKAQLLGDCCCWPHHFVYCDTVRATVALFAVLYVYNVAEFWAFAKNRRLFGIL